MTYIKPRGRPPKRNKPPVKTNVKIEISEEDWRRLRARCVVVGRTVQSVLGEIVKEWLNR